MKNNIPYVRKETSTLLVFSAAVLMILLASPLPLSNPILLQPVQAQTAPTSFRTPEPANSEDRNYALSFDAQGTLSTNSSGYQPMNGTFQINSISDGSIINSGDIDRGRLYNNSQGVESIELVSRITAIATSCSTSANNTILVDEDPYRGVVDCDLGGETTAQPSTPPITGISQDRDTDGIPDSSDRCASDSNPRCFKEGDTTTQSSSTTSIAGNQTR